MNLGGDGTHQVCYGEKWLEKFFNAVHASRDWLECVHPGRYVRSVRVSREKVYVPGPTYDALMQWTQMDGSASLHRNQDKSTAHTAVNSRSGDDDFRPNAFYREFLTKYRESGLLYAKMMHIEVLTNQLRGDKYRKKSAKEELWRGQEHYAYWHGPTGGIYNTRIRHTAYKALIEAEKATREKGIFKAALTSLDFDMDGEKEYLYNGLNFNAYVHPVGGSLFELDYLPVSRNYLATFSRYPENYHPPATREQGYDLYPRHAFIDHILKPEDTMESFERMSSRHCSVFPLKRYTPVDVVRDQPKVSLRCKGPINGDTDSLDLHKTYRFRRNSLEIDYMLTNLTPRTLNFSWGTEINLALADEAELRELYLNSDDSEAVSVAEHGCGEKISSWTIVDKQNDVVMQFILSEPGDLWHFPVFADYRVGRELRRNYQSSCFVPNWKLELSPMDSHFYRITFRIGRSKTK